MRKGGQPRIKIDEEATNGANHYSREVQNHPFRREEVGSGGYRENLL